LCRIESIATLFAHAADHDISSITDATGDGIGVDRGGVAVDLASRTLGGTLGDGVVAISARNTPFGLGGGAIVSVVSTCWTKQYMRCP
jgi:hypothetical protein